MTYFIFLRINYLLLAIYIFFQIRICPLSIALYLDFSYNTGRSEDYNEKKYRSNEMFFERRWYEQKKNTFLTDFGNIFFYLKSRLLITIGQNIDKALNLIIDMYHKAADAS